MVDIACDTTVSVTLNFGSRTWAISDADFNLGTIDARGQNCVGGIFDLDAGTNIDASNSIPAWVVGDTFLVRCSLFSRYSLPG